MNQFKFMNNNQENKSTSKRKKSFKNNIPNLYNLKKYYKIKSIKSKKRVSSKKKKHKDSLNKKSKAEQKLLEKYKELMDELKQKRNEFEQENIKSLGKIEDIDDDFLCIVCYRQIADHNFQPCGHRGCKECLLTYLSEKTNCFMCRQPVVSIGYVPKEELEKIIGKKLNENNNNNSIYENTVECTKASEEIEKDNKDDDILNLKESEENKNNEDNKKNEDEKEENNNIYKNTINDNF